MSEIKTKTMDLQQSLKHASKDDLKELIKNTNYLKFSEYINHLITHKNQSKSDIILKSNLDRTYAYQIFSGTKVASKYKIVALALAMNCSLDECNKLLTLSNNSILYAKDEVDALIIFSISNNLSLLEVNELLVEHGFNSI